MSEYQYYDFQAVDHPLTREQMEELRSYSTRARITPTSFSNEYNWGVFKADPVEWMEKYFDAFLHVTNWGSRWIILRMPKRSLDIDTASMYCDGESVSLHTKGEHVFLSFMAEEVQCHDWMDGEGWLASFLPLRSDVMRGDYRCLYLGWLFALQECELGGKDNEPPVPGGLSELTTSLQSLVEFFDIDPDLIAAAAEKSDLESVPALSDKEVKAWIAKLPADEKDSMVEAFLNAENLHASEELRQRARREICGGTETGGGQRRRVIELVERAESIRMKRKHREAESRAREEAKREKEESEKRQKYLQSIAGREEEFWGEVDTLIAKKQPRRYDEAISILEDIRDVAVVEGQEQAFRRRLAALVREHAKKPSLLDRLRTANFLS